jgi:pimeloyl-ACP methyl ester carboxylesterase
MSMLFLVLFSLSLAKTPTVQTQFVMVAPARSPGQNRAVVLIHGLSVVPFSSEKTVKPILRTWQLPDSVLVKELSRDSDVYALAYGQNVACDRISAEPMILGYLRNLKKAGYRDIVLVGHSAGGLVARHLVEDNPPLGVTKVVQVCAPNAGSGWAALRAARSVQVAFLASLTLSARQRILAERKNTRIPGTVQFACVVASAPLAGHSDGVVSCRSQWSEDLQAQGVPAHALQTTHWDAVRAARGAKLIARIVREPQQRWAESTVREVRKKLLGQ